MTDKEIVNDLKYHSNHFCTDADYQNMIKLALDLINRQKAEIERLEKIQTSDGAECPICYGTGKIGTTDWLTKDISKKQLAKENEKAIAENNAKIKSKAYKEFAEKTNSIIDSLIEKYSIKDFEEFKAICQVLRGLKNDTNNLLKELVGDDNAE